MNPPLSEKVTSVAFKSVFFSLVAASLVGCTPGDVDQFTPHTIVPTAPEMAPQNESDVVSNPNINVIYYSGWKGHTDEQQQLADQLTKAYIHAKLKLEMEPIVKTVVIIDDSDSYTQANAYFDKNQIVFTVNRDHSSNDGSFEHITKIAAHEFIHDLERQKFGQESFSQPTFFAEGLATWGADDYWLDGSQNFKEYYINHYGRDLTMFQDIYDEGYRISEGNGPVTIDENLRTQKYYGWASFIEYIYETYGMDYIRKMAITTIKNESMPTKIDFPSVFQKSEQQIVEEWMRWMIN